MQYLVTVTIAQAAGAPPAELQAAMTALVEAETSRGTVAVSGAFAPDDDGARLTLSAGGVEQGSARLPLHGFAVVEASSLDDALDVARRMVRLHQQHVPGWEASWEVRPIVTHCLP
jgi:hypothetical protein